MKRIVSLIVLALFALSFLALAQVETVPADTTAVAPQSLISIQGLMAIVLILSLAASELMPFLPTKANGIVHLVVNVARRIVGLPPLA